MKQLFLIFSFILLAVNILAQERQTLTTDYESGKLTFQYYEKDGVKVPDGLMSYTRESTNDYRMKTTYKESGSNMDGYKDGEWVIEADTPGRFYKISMNYKEGLLDGPLKFQEYSYQSKNGKKNLVTEDSLVFREGYLVGENKYVHNSDTLYFNYDNNGHRTGEWRLCQPQGKIKGGTFNYTGDSEYYPYKPNYEISDVYEMDILGQKIPKDNFMNNFGMTIAMPLIFFKQKLDGDPTFIRYHERVKLPTLHKNKYGFIDKL